MNREQEMVSIACKAIDDKKALKKNNKVFLTASSAFNFSLPAHNYLARYYQPGGKFL